MLRVRSMVRLLCDGTNLREGGEMKEKQNSEVSNPVMSHPNAEAIYQKKTELPNPRICRKIIWRSPFNFCKIEKPDGSPD